MEAFGKIAALILLPVSLCLAQPLAVGGSISYSSLLGDFGGDVNGIVIDDFGFCDMCKVGSKLMTGFCTVNRKLNVLGRKILAFMILDPFTQPETPGLTTLEFPLRRQAGHQFQVLVTPHQRIINLMLYHES